jgi:hypothetical protein
MFSNFKNPLLLVDEHFFKKLHGFIHNEVVSLITIHIRTKGALEKMSLCHESEPLNLTSTPFLHLRLLPNPNY